MPTEEHNSPRRRIQRRDLLNIWRFARLLWEAAPFLVCLSVVFRLVRASLPVATLYVSKLIVDTVILQLHNKHVVSRRVVELIIIELSIVLCSDIISRLISLTQSILVDQFTNQVNIRIIGHAAKLDLSHFEHSTFYDKLQRAQRHGQGRLQIIEQLAGTVENLSTLLVLTSSLLFFSPWLLSMLVLAVLPTFFGETEYAANEYSLFYRWTGRLRELDYFRGVVTMLETAAEVKTFALGHYFVTKYKELATLYCLDNRRIVVRKAVIGSVLSVIGTLGYYTAYAILIFRTVGGLLSVGDLTFFAGAFRESRHMISDLIIDFSSWSREGIYLNDLFEFFDTKNNIRSLPNALPVPRPIKNRLEFRDVSFRYPGTERIVLSNVSFEIRTGERIALVGENGSGKTTMAKLIPRLYDPTEGSIVLDGVDLREYQLDSWRREVSVIFQHYVRYNLTILENIGLGSVEHMNDRERIHRSARLSGSADLVSRLGLDQTVGRQFRDGVELSGGEWQKLSLARAYMKDAQMVILDEPTAALDARSERNIFEQFLRLSANKMAIIISHRFSTVRKADRVLVIHNGRILEEGSHDDLIRFHGRYAELFELQAAGYR